MANTSANSVVAWLSGKKTYIVAFGLGVFNVALQVGLVHLAPETISTVNAVLAALGLGALRASVSTSQK